MAIRYVHTNLVARDWRRLAEFYHDVFGCEPVPPERDLSGSWLEEATGLPRAALRGLHLRLPGYGLDGPTLEIFSYAENAEKLPAAPNRLGFGHLAFSVDDVDGALAQVLSHGGRAVGKTVSREIPGAGRVTFVYAADPEGNIVELQHWSPVRL